MSNPHKLSSDDRAFFTLVARACFANPFSEARHELDRAIGDSEDDVGDPDRVRRAVAAVRKRVDKLEQKGRADFRAFAAADQEVVKHTFLFDVFHQYLPDLDKLIRKQRKQGKSSCPVPIAEAALARLHSFGFDEEEALRAFAMCYQLRRAFFFIYQNLIGNCASMQALRLHLWHNVFTHDVAGYNERMWNRMEDFSTLLLGETGSGKGAAASAIGQSGFIPFNPERHRFQQSFAQLFVGINLAQFPETLIESELFGHKRGSFTGAVQDYDGVLSRSLRYGAMFLDEIGDTSIPVQIKLLNVLQDRTFTKVGGHDPLRFEGRVIAATNRDLIHLRQQGEFRDDFYYRLCSDCIEIPSLRQRIQEDPTELTGMLAHIVRRITGREDEALERDLQSTLTDTLGPSYAWSGNVRELEQAVRRLLLSGDYAGDPLRNAETGRDLADRIAAGTMTAQDLTSAYCRELYAAHQSYADVARITELDWRTVKKYVESD